jgi:putative hemolysin
LKIIASIAALAASAAMLVGPSTALAASPSDDFVAPAMAKAAAYCKQTGGHVEVRIPEYGTNGSNPLVLDGDHAFCRYYQKSDKSHIHLFLSTLVSTQPTLAALAYYAEVQPGSCQGNPASCYCTLLGGSDQFGGTSGNGGAWVKNNAPDADLEACIFPDLSSIDSWGLTYHSQGIIRGKDLSTVLKYPNPYGNKKTDAKQATGVKAFTTK